MTGSSDFVSEAHRRPKGGSVSWVQTRDGKNLRVGFWPATDARGTILMFSGRTEFIEKYGPAAIEFAERGFAMATLDWRGQGASDRLLENPAIGHVENFNDYQLDVDAFMEAVNKSDLPRPFYLIAHSMGGAIGLRALVNGLDVKASAFSAPMWDIQMSPAKRVLANVAGTILSALGLDGLRAPGTDKDNYVLVAEFEDNTLTRDREMWDFMSDTLANNLELGVAGPSCKWVLEAMKECADLRKTLLPAVPTIVGLGTEESIIDPKTAKQVTKRWASAELLMFEGCQHELLMEGPEVRARFMDACVDLFDANRAD